MRNLENRIEKLMAIIEGEGADAVVLTKPEHLYYFTGFVGTLGYFLASRGGARVLLVDSRYTTQAREQVPPGIDVVEFRLPGITDALTRQIQRINIRRVGFEGNHLVYSEWNRFSACLAQAVDGLEVISIDVSSARMIKEEEEISKIKTAVQIACEALRRTLPAVRPGGREMDVAA
ncbi:MAG: aminopeptidase P family N-terminal domain-containing protein, partial [Negativicutes bacterium]|nr:aminopeptidase P family N-terminal domain-containing protein [Negativicutes bacterium]